MSNEYDFPDDYTEEEKAEYVKDFGYPTNRVRRIARRDEEVIIDRVHDPPEKLKEVLPDFKPKKLSERIREENPRLSDKFKNLAHKTEDRIKESAPKVAKGLGKSAKSGLKNLATNLRTEHNRHAGKSRRQPRTGRGGIANMGGARLPSIGGSGMPGIVFDKPGTGYQNHAIGSAPVFNHDFLFGNNNGNMGFGGLKGFDGSVFDTPASKHRRRQL